jgi:hypothetical protein
VYNSLYSPPWSDVRCLLTPLHHTKRAFFFQVPENLSNRNAPYETSKQAFDVHSSMNNQMHNQYMDSENDYNRKETLFLY